MYYNNGNYGFHFFLTFLLSFPLAFSIIAIPIKSIKIVLVTLLWLLAIPELFMLAASYSYFTAGEMMAVMCANKSEFLLLFKFLWLQPKIWWIATTLLFMLIIYAICHIQFNHKINGIVAGISALITCVILLISPIPLKEIFPYNFLREQGCLICELHVLRHEQNANRDFYYNAHTNNHAVDKEVYVLAIGESLRYRNFGLNGSYSRQTTPLISQENNIVLYNNCYSSAVLTQHALPLLISTAVADNYDSHYKEGRIGKAFVEAGYKTYLISNDKQLSNDGVHTYLTSGFDSIIYISADSIASTYVATLSAESAKTFILIHYLGNHFFYGNRTEEYGKWQPDFNDNPLAESDSLFINAYDNSILYTDYILHEDIRELKRLNTPASFVFISDHGDYYDEKIAVHGHTYHPTKDEYHVPLMVWYSDEYAEAYPEKVANMIKHKDEPVCADHVFWSVLDMAGIRIDSTLQQDGMSIFGDTLLPHKRTLLLPDGKSVMELD